MLATQCHIPEYVIPQNKGSVLDLAAEGHTFSVIIHLILNLSLKQVHILFQSDFFTECDLVIPLSTSSTISSDEVFRICLFFWKNTIRRSNNVKVFRSVRRIAKSDYKLRHVRPSVLMEQHGSHWEDFHEIWYSSIFRKSVEENSSFIQSDKNNGPLHEKQSTFFLYLTKFFLE